MDYGDNQTLSNHLEESRTNLFTYFDENYTLHNPTPSLPPSTPVQAPPIDGSPQKSFTARYRRKMNYSTNELEEYFKLPAEDFQSCNPIQWWVGRRSQFPCLFQLVRDILCIPGLLNPVDHCELDLNYLSGSDGRDTISLRRASLQANSIRILMLVKKRLHLARTKAA